MTGQPPAPGRDEITVTAPAGRVVCNTLQHARLGVLADVVVTFGELGTEKWHRDSVWPGCWGQSYPLCSECRDITVQVAKGRRSSLVITDTTAQSG